MAPYVQPTSSNKLFHLSKKNVISQSAVCRQSCEPHLRDLRDFPQITAIYYPIKQLIYFSTSFVGKRITFASAIFVFA